MIPDHIAHVELQRLEEVVPEASEAPHAEVGTKILPKIPASARLITVDGVDGAGKSTFATHLATCIGGVAVSLDNYIIKRRDSYVPAMRMEEVAEAIVSGLGIEAKVIVEGCMIEEVLAHLGIAPDFRVYVMKANRRPTIDHTFLDDRELLYGDLDAEALIAEKERQAEMFARFCPDDSPAR